jgi:vanillate monooxygenase ferredoxin subunit
MMGSAQVFKVRVARKRIEAEDICSFELVDVNGAALPGFSAGAHIDVHVPGGLTRQYSLCNDSAETHRYQIAVLKDSASRGGSHAMHDSVHEGSLLEISQPKNHFPLAHGAAKSVLLAGGIGVTPILCMAERLATAGADFEMHYSTRSRSRTAFLDRITASGFADKVHLHFDDAGPAQALDLTSQLAAPLKDQHLYVCGPKGFMDAVLGVARANGWPESQLHYEFFSADVGPLESDTDFDLKLASSGRIIKVAKDQTVTQALSAAGIEVQTSCEQGVCGTCLTRVLEGTPDHKDMYLTPEEQAANDQFTPCCSRSKTKVLVLDL